MISKDRIIVGCANFGGVGSVPELIGKGETVKESRALLNLMRDLGLYRFDTANTYGGGASEDILGDWLLDQSAAFLAKVEISTKVGSLFGCSPGNTPLSRQEIALHLETSLLRLNLESISVYYLHVLDPETPLEETLEALSRAVDAGKVKSLGLSNVNKEQVEKVLSTAGPLAKYFTHVQNEFHRLHTIDTQALIPYLAAKGMKYTAYGPLAGGLLTGKYKSPKRPPEGSRLSLRGDSYERFLTDENLQKIKTWVEEAKAQNLTPAESAIKFILSSQGVDSVLIGPRNAEQLENLGVS